MRVVKSTLSDLADVALFLVALALVVFTLSQNVGLRRPVDRVDPGTKELKADGRGVAGAGSPGETLNTRESREER